MNNLLIISQPQIIFNETFYNCKVEGLDSKQSADLYKILMLENFTSLKNNKLWKTKIILNKLDGEFVPSVYNTVDNQILERGDQESDLALMNFIKALFLKDVKKVLIVFANSFDISQEDIKLAFDSMYYENEKIVLGFSNSEKMTFLGFNSPKFNFIQFLENQNQKKDGILKKCFFESAEIQIFTKGNLCHTSEELKKLIHLQKSSAFKSFSSQLILFLNSITTKRE